MNVLVRRDVSEEKSLRRNEQWSSVYDSDESNLRHRVPAYHTLVLRITEGEICIQMRNARTFTAFLFPLFGSRTASLTAAAAGATFT